MAHGARHGTTAVVDVSGDKTFPDIPTSAENGRNGRFYEAVVETLKSSR